MAATRCSTRTALSELATRSGGDRKRRLLLPLEFDHPLLAARGVMVRHRFILFALGAGLVACTDELATTPDRAREVGQPTFNGTPTIPSGKIIGVSTAAPEYIGIGNRITELGVEYVRMEIKWWEWRNTRSFDPGYFTSQLNRVDPASTKKILVSVGYRFHSDPGTGHPTGVAAYAHCGLSSGEENACVPTAPSPEWNTFLADWTTFVDQVVSTYKHRITYWAPWNEANEPSFFNGQPWQYDSLAAVLCNRVHQEPGLTCVGPETALFPPPEENTKQTLAWTVARLAATNFDIVSVHSYGTASLVASEAARVRAAIGTKPLWITETGPVAPQTANQAYDVELQERGVAATYDWFKGGQSDATGLFYYHMHSPENGLMKDGMPRPAFYALKRKIAGTYMTLPRWGLCSGDAWLATCSNFYALADPASQGLVRARVIDFTGAPVANIQIRGYHSTGVLGDKWTDYQGIVTFQTTTTREYGVYMVQQTFPAGISALTGDSLYYHALVPTPDSPRTRTFDVNNGTCSIRARAVNEYEEPIADIRFVFYHSSHAVGYVLSDSDGYAVYPGPFDPPLDCGRAHGVLPDWYPGYSQKTPTHHHDLFLARRWFSDARPRAINDTTLKFTFR